MFRAPNERRHAASAYKNYFNIRLTSHNDNGRTEHFAAHHCASQVRLFAEAAVMCFPEIGLYSCDCKAVVPIGVVAVSKYIRKKSYLLSTRSVPDHSFTTSSSVKPVVIMRLDCAPAAASGKHVDVHGRPMRIFLRASCFVDSNAATHIEHFKAVYREQKELTPAVFLMSDNASDYAPSSFTVAYFLWLAFKELKLDFLAAVSYAPGHSASNPVERGMAVLSSAMAGEVFGKKPELSKPEENERMHSNAVKDMARVLSGTRDGYSFTATAVSFDTEDERPSEQDDDGEPKENRPNVAQSPSRMYATVQQVMRKGRKATMADPVRRGIFEDMQVMLKHLDRRLNAAIFVRCVGKESCTHCRTLGAPRAEKLLALVKRCDGNFFTPIPSDHPDVAPPNEEQVEAGPVEDPGDDADCEYLSQESRASCTQAGPDEEAGAEPAIVDQVKAAEIVQQRKKRSRTAVQCEDDDSP
ncbi:hypothetical protein DIPPA_32682 [Diplonema papillatum]|nr:hypothetical protein DIPPA_32682 [Diplonema papillatum]